MVLEVGSMLIKAKFDTGNIMTGLSGMVGKLKESTLTAKSATNEFMRMKGTLIGLAGAAGLSAGVLLGMLTNAVMQSPFLAAALEKLKNEFMLFGNAIAKHVAPILEKLVGLVKWLREKFEALPDPVQSTIVKIVILSGVVLGLIGGLSLLGIGIGLIKSGLVTLGLSGAATKFGALSSAIIDSTLSSALFAIGLGLVAGGLAVLVLDKIGVIKWFEDLGASIDFTNRKLRDLLIALGTPAAVFGTGILDIVRGTPDWGMTRQLIKQGEEAAWRYRQGVSGHYGEGERIYSGDIGKTVVIENQTVEIHNDFGGITGDITDPATLWEATVRYSEQQAENQQYLNV